MVEVLPGDATKVRPEKHGIVLAHVVNNLGKWGAGFVLALDKLSPISRVAYLEWARQNNFDIPLGTVQWVEIMPRMIISNMCAQRGTKTWRSGGVRLIDYDMFDKCLIITLNRAIRLGYEVHMPSGIGSGLAGGKKAVIHRLITKASQEIEQKLLKKLIVKLWELKS